MARERSRLSSSELDPRCLADSILAVRFDGERAAATRADDVRPWSEGLHAA
jgi:hypothetical protein